MTSTARVVTWNLERKRADRGRGAEAVDHLFGLDPDVMVLTEARTTFPERGGHLLWCEPPVGSRFGADERKVVMWSRSPWTDVDRVGADRAGTDRLDARRFVAATTQTPIGPVRVLGVCIPWHMAEVNAHQGVKRKPWETHLAYLHVLASMLIELDQSSVIAGDFNQRVPRGRYGNAAASAALAAAFAPVDIVTAGQPEGVAKPGIDHIAITRDLRAQRVWGWPNDVTGNRLSDHDGAGVDLTRR